MKGTWYTHALAFYANISFLHHGYRFTKHMVHACLGLLCQHLVPTSWLSLYEFYEPCNLHTLRLTRCQRQHLQALGSMHLYGTPAPCFSFLAGARVLAVRVDDWRAFVPSYFLPVTSPYVARCLGTGTLKVSEVLILNQPSLLPITDHLVPCYLFSLSCNLNSLISMAA